jgi:hypothetical protein
VSSKTIQFRDHFRGFISAPSSSKSWQFQAPNHGLTFLVASTSQGAHREFHIRTDSCLPRNYKGLGKELLALYQEPRSKTKYQKRCT